MRSVLSLLALVALAVAFPQDPSASKEENYKKYIGQTNYALPFKTKLSDPFKDGQTIHVVGTLNDNPKRVDFNFHKGAAKDSDLPLHFSIRFDEGLIGSGKLVYNTFKDGNWSDTEQRVSNPFRANEEFDLRVRINNGKFQVFANRAEIGTFEQRQPLEGIDHVSVRGDLTKLELLHYGGRVFTIPYTARSELRPGKRLDVSGLATGKRFNINLYRENKEYALQVSVRYNEKAVVRNAMQNGVWGTEEREGDFPLNKYEIVDVTIINEPYSIQLFLNGKRYATFAHRGSADDIKTLEIDGEIDIHSVTINDAIGH